MMMIGQGVLVWLMVPHLIKSDTGIENRYERLSG